MDGWSWVQHAHVTPTAASHSRPFSKPEAAKRSAAAANATAVRLSA